MCPKSLDHFYTVGRQYELNKISWTHGIRTYENYHYSSFHAPAGCHLKIFVEFECLNMKNYKSFFGKNLNPSLALNGSKHKHIELKAQLVKKEPKCSS